MSFFSTLTPPSRKGEKNFERARAAEGRGSYDQARDFFEIAATAFDAHFAQNIKKGSRNRPSHLVMAGICYTRLGRNEDALTVLNACIAAKEIPDAFLHAGYAAAKLGQVDKAVDYWSRYPQWVEQRIIADTLRKQGALLRGPAPDLQAACEAVATAVQRQDKANARTKMSTPERKPVPPNRGY